MFKQTPFLAAHLIDRRAWDFLDLCAASSIDARLVGGCVRDALLLYNTRSTNQLLSCDIDIAIACTPQDVIAFCKKQGLKYIPTGIAHGTVMILFKGLVLEVTSLRADIDTHGRHATVMFGASFEEDAKRRDFTMNALYVDHQRQLHDALGGVADVYNGCVRFISDPGARIAEDYLRLYRYFRFWGRFGRGKADISVLPVLSTIKDGLAHVSIERVQSEFFKILMLPWPGAVLKSMHHYGLLGHIFGNAINFDASIHALRRLVILEHSGKQILCPIRRLCALTQAQKCLSVLRLSRVQKKKSENLTTFKDPNEIVLTHPEWWVDSMLLSDAVSSDSLWLCREHTKALKPPPPFPLTGADVLAMGIIGARIGEMLIAVKREWVASNFTLDREECLTQLRPILDGHSSYAFTNAH
jgi:poly(A) polymerase